MLDDGDAVDGDAAYTWFSVTIPGGEIILYGKVLTGELSDDVDTEIVSLPDAADGLVTPSTTTVTLEESATATGVTIHISGAADVGDVLLQVPLVLTVYSFSASTPFTV